MIRLDRAQFRDDFEEEEVDIRHMSVLNLTLTPVEENEIFRYDELNIPLGISLHECGNYSQSSLKSSTSSNSNHVFALALYPHLQHPIQ